MLKQEIDRSLFDGSYVYGFVLSKAANNFIEYFHTSAQKYFWILILDKFESLISTGTSVHFSLFLRIKEKNLLFDSQNWWVWNRWTVPGQIMKLQRTLYKRDQIRILVVKFQILSPTNFRDSSRFTMVQPQLFLSGLMPRQHSFEWT